METIKELNERIFAITAKINKERPELLEFLNEMPVTVPNESNPEITAGILSDYCDSLKNLFTKAGGEENADSLRNSSCKATKKHEAENK